MRALRFLLHSAAVIATAVMLCTGAASAQTAQVQLVVPRVIIYPNQVIEPGMLVMRTFRATADVAAALPSEAVVGKVSRQTLLPGRPIFTEAVRAPHAVTQGQAALIVFQSGALTITGNAVALQSGGTGDMVTVRNVDSGRIIKGTIGADGAVHVGDP